MHATILAVMASQEFEGWLGADKSAAKGNIQQGKFEPKKWQEDDVEIEIPFCGVCISVLHTLSSGWGPTAYRKRNGKYNTKTFFFLQKLVCVVGHGTVHEAVDSGLQHVKIGDSVGVGAQARSCLPKNCADCSSGLENHCTVS